MSRYGGRANPYAQQEGPSGGAPQASFGQSPRPGGGGGGAYGNQYSPGYGKFQIRFERIGKAQ